MARLSFDANGNTHAEPPASATYPKIVSHPTMAPYRSFGEVWL